MRPEPSASLSEIFSSLQGEGPYCGERQIFIRFSGCNLRCDYCDTPDSLTPAPDCEVGPLRDPNPLTLARVLEHLAALEAAHGPHAAVSLTGGEPLLQAGFLRAILPEIRRGGWRTYLETNGVLPEAFRRVVAEVDVAAVDLKLPSAVGREFWEEHEEFLRIAVAGAGRLFVKVIVSANSPPGEVRRAVTLVRRVDRRIPLVLQPVTPRPASVGSTGVEAADGRRVASLAAEALADLETVLVLPQMHRVLGVP